MPCYHAECHGKTAYETKLQALERIRRHMKDRKRRKRSNGLDAHCHLVPYRCRVCGYWHTGSDNTPFRHKQRHNPHQRIQLTWSALDG